VASDANPDLLSVGFRDVDATASDKILRCLGTLQTMESVRSYKVRALELLNLGPDSSALDVACGLGDDVAALKTRCARAVGLDQSAMLLALAEKRHPDCEFGQADASKLPFPEETFDAVRIDRSLQHIDQPGLVIQEMARVTRRGGVVLCAEPDWGTFLLGGLHSPVMETIEQTWIRTFRNPWIGRELATYLARAGVSEIQTEALWLPTRGLEQTEILYEVSATVERLSPPLPEAQAWLDSYRAGEVYAGVLIVICSGRKL
jgi:ubiquinone/menaquinone biosynthesis C-methylase UbiE